MSDEVNGQFQSLFRHAQGLRSHRILRLITATLPHSSYTIGELYTKMYLFRHRRRIEYKAKKKVVHYLSYFQIIPMTSLSSYAFKTNETDLSCDFKLRLAPPRFNI